MFRLCIYFLVDIGNSDETLRHRIRRAISTVETSFRPTGDKLNKDSHSQPTSPKQRKGREFTVHVYSNNHVNEQRSCQSNQSLQAYNQKQLSAKEKMTRSKSEEGEPKENTKPASISTVKSANSNLSDDDSDEGARSSTPLLARHGSNSSKSKENKKDSSCIKKVSFTQSNESLMSEDNRWDDSGKSCSNAVEKSASADVVFKKKKAKPSTSDPLSTRKTNITENSGDRDGLFVYNLVCSVFICRISLIMLI